MNFVLKILKLTLNVKAFSKSQIRGIMLCCAATADSPFFCVAKPDPCVFFFFMEVDMFFADSSRGTLIESYQGGVFLLDKSTLLLFTIRFFFDHPLQANKQAQKDDMDDYKK